MSSSRSEAACSDHCWLSYRPWANQSSGIQALLWTYSCTAPHIVFVPWRYRMEDWPWARVHHLQTAGFIQDIDLGARTHQDAAWPLEETQVRPGDVPRRYMMLSRRMLDDQGIYFSAGPANVTFSRFVGFAGFQWLGNVLILRVDDHGMPMDIEAKDEARLSPLLYRSFTAGHFNRRGISQAWFKPWDVERYVSTLPLELATMVASLLPFRELVTLHKLSMIWRAAAVTVVEQMRLYNAVLYGSMGRMVMRTGLHLRNNLNFAVGGPDALPFTMILSNILNVPWVQQEVYNGRKAQMAQWIIWTLNDGRQVTLGVSRHPSFLPTVLGAVSTSQMDFVTSDHLVSPYPQLSMHGISLLAITREWTAEQNNIYHAQNKMKMLCLEDNSGWQGDCGYNCPNLIRDVDGFSGFGLIQWGSESGTVWSEGYESWRLSRCCDNPECEHPDRSDENVPLSPGNNWGNDTGWA
ncbi:hypothetical protein C8J56DRAFT_887160 [Mycena floridula]|nr:hypothetical protein C8J56DRAFT_887160 [Mycena floridula]